MAFRDDFDGPDLDTDVWLPHYLPAWSSRAADPGVVPAGGLLPGPRRAGRPPGVADPRAAAAGVGRAVGQLVGPGRHPVGQQRFEEGQLVREEQPRFEGWLPASGHVEIRCRMTLSPRSMGALWLSGFEDDHEQLRCGELCVVEIFGRSVQDGVVRGRHGHQGVPRPRPHPGLRRAHGCRSTSPSFHTYAVDWDADEAVFSVDGGEVRRCPRPPTYPLQLMVAVYDFPEWSVGDDDHLVPELVVDHIAG